MGGRTGACGGLYPPLTTVKVNRYEMGRRAVRRLLARLRGETKVPTITSLGFEIVDAKVLVRTSRRPTRFSQPFGMEC